MVVPTPPSIPLILRSMVSNNSSRRFSCETPPSSAPETDALDPQEPISDISIPENSKNLYEESGGSRFSMDESQIILNDENTHVSEDCKLLGDGEPNIVSTPLSMQANEEENAKAARSSKANSSAWEPEDVDAPQVPKCYVKVAESKFPIQVEEFFNMFFSEDGVSFEESYHRKIGDEDFKCTSWEKCMGFGYIRRVLFQRDVNTTYFGKTVWSYREIQRYGVYRNCHLVVHISQEKSKITFGTYFDLEARWDIEEESTDSTPGCILRVYVPFYKPTGLSGMFPEYRIEDSVKDFEIWIKHAHEVLNPKNLEKEEDVKGQVTYPPVQENFSKTSNGSFIGGDIFAKFKSASSKHQKTACLLVITVAIVLILMQISTPAFLMSRRQQISQANTKGMGENMAAEALTQINMETLLEKLHFVETLLKNMQHEQALMMEKLKDLDLFRNQP